MAVEHLTMGTGEYGYKSKLWQDKIQRKAFFLYFFSLLFIKREKNVDMFLEIKSSIHKRRLET